MPEPDIPDNAPGTQLFPQFESELYNMYTQEVDGLTDQQLDFESDRWEWAKWSIRRNVSHVASGEFRWLIIRWGNQIFPQGLPVIDDMDNILSPKYDRRMDEDKYWQMGIILPILRKAHDLCHQVLSQETVGSLRSKELQIDYNPQWQLFAQAHPRGLRQDPNDSSKAFLSLEATLRHRYYEYTTHLFNIQRLKRAQGLTAKVNIPQEGYLVLPTWDRSEA